MVNRALILANEQFADPEIRDLESPLADGARLKALLEREDVGGYEVTLCKNADSPTARGEIQEFFDSAKADDQHVLVLSGHGIRDGNNRLHFATRDTTKKKLAASSLEAQFVRDRMNDCQAARKILLIDACHSGAYLDGMVPKDAAGLTITQNDFGDFNTRGTTIITASNAIEYASEKEHDGRKQSVFTRCLIEGIETGAADSSQDGKITLGDLYNYICRRMKTEAKSQTPQCLDLSDGGTMVFALNPAFKALALPEEVLAKLASGVRLQLLDAVGDLETIATSGAREAQLALFELRRLAKADVLVSVKDQAISALGRVGDGGGRTESAVAQPLVGGKLGSVRRSDAAAAPKVDKISKSISASGMYPYSGYFFIILIPAMLLVFFVWYQNHIDNQKARAQFEVYKDECYEKRLADSCALAGYASEKGDSGVTDYSNGQLYFQKACELGNSDSCSMPGVVAPAARDAAAAAAEAAAAASDAVKKM